MAAQSQGYEADFDPPLEKRLECPICLLGLRDPIQTPCGHRFCGSCLHRAIQVTGSKCPVDNLRIRVTQLFRDNFAKREVLSLRVRCANRERGCDWQGELRGLEPHRGACPLEEIQCPNDCELSASRKVVNLHLDDCPKRWVSCEKCNLYVPFDTLEAHGGRCNRIVLSPSQPAVNHKRHLIWSGQLEWKDTGKQPICGEETTPVTEHLLVHASIKPTEPAIDTRSWPTCLHLHLVKSDLLCYIQDVCCMDRDPTKIGLYLAGPHNHLVNGLYVQFVAKIGCVIFPQDDDSDCEVEGFLMLWDRKLKSFVAIMPKQQKGFRARLKSAIAQNNNKRHCAHGSTWIPARPEEVFDLDDIARAGAVATGRTSPVQWADFPPRSSPPSTQRSNRSRGSRSTSRRRNQNSNTATLPNGSPHTFIPAGLVQPSSTALELMSHHHSAARIHAIPPPPMLPYTLPATGPTYVLTQQPGQSQASSPPPMNRAPHSRHHVVFHPYARYAQPVSSAPSMASSQASNSSFFIPGNPAAVHHHPVTLGEQGHHVEQDVPFGLVWDCMMNHRQFPIDILPSHPPPSHVPPPDSHRAGPQISATGHPVDHEASLRISQEPYLSSPGYALMPSVYPAGVCPR